MLLGDMSNSKTFTSVKYDQITVQREDGFVQVGTILCPTAFFNTVESLTTNKVVAICEMGFGALQLIGCPKLYPKVCQLMVEGLDPLNETVRIHGKNFVIKSSDFARIMGIKDGGTDIDLCGDLTATIFQHLTKRLAAGAGEITCSSLKHIVGEKIAVDRDFKVGYVLFAMSSLLCPVGADEVDKTLMLTLIDTTAIKGKNWATYCFNKLLSGVLTFKSNKSGSLSGCMIFLQLFYFETVGGSSGWVDRTLTPLLSWGDAEVRELVSWVEQRGGIRSSNASVWAISTGSKKRLTPPTDVSQLESQSGLAYFDMCSLRSDLDALAREFFPLQQSVVKMEPTVAELLITSDRIERSISTFPGDSIRLIVVEVLKRLNYSQNPQSEYRPDSATGIPPTYPKSQRESHAGNDGKASQRSEDPSVMFLYEQNRNNGLPDELQVPHIAGDGLGSGAMSTVSELSVSPIGPPKLARRSIKEKLRKRSTAVPKKKGRSLFKIPATTIATHLMQGRTKLNRPKCNMNTEGLFAGPFLVPADTAQHDIELLNFIFMELASSDLQSRFSTSQLHMFVKTTGMHLIKPGLILYSIRSMQSSP